VEMHAAIMAAPAAMSVRLVNPVMSTSLENSLPGSTR
jgi:hypothetical protein